MVQAALAAIDSGQLEKVVLAREVIVDADTPFDLRDIVRRLVSQQPGCFVYASDGLVGASPELLVRRIDDEVESLPVAGTAVADGDEASLRALAASVKDHREHRFVVDAIVETLEEYCDELDAGSRTRGRGVRSRCPPRDPRERPLACTCSERARHRTAVASEPSRRRHTAAGRGRSHPRPRGIRSRPLRRADRLGRCPWKWRVGDRAPRRPARRFACTPGCGRGDRDRIGARRRVGRDPGQARADAPRSCDPEGRAIASKRIVARASSTRVRASAQRARASARRRPWHSRVRYRLEPRPQPPPTPRGAG